MKTLISIDPGVSTGLIAGTYSDDTPFELTHAFQIEGGVEGFVAKSFSGYDPGYGFDYTTICDVEVDDALVIVEKFNARGSANAGFAYRTEALEPLRIEGAILALGIRPTWVSPPQQYFMGGKSKAEKLKNRNAWFKDHKDLGYYITGKDVGCKDSDDARSALAHCISYLRREKHLPTLGLFRRDEDEG